MDLLFRMQNRLEDYESGTLSPALKP